MTGDIHIHDLSRWILENTDTSALGLRVICASGTAFISASHYCRDTHGNLKNLGLGADELVLVHGKTTSVLKSLVDCADDPNDHLMKAIVSTLREEAGKVSFFETTMQGVENRLATILAWRLGCSIEEFWFQHTDNCHPCFASLGDKLEQRRLVEEAGHLDLFTPHFRCRVDPHEIWRHIVRILETMKTPNVLVRADGAASSDLQMVYPMCTVEQIVEMLAGARVSECLVEPFLDHQAVSAQLWLGDEGVEVLGLTDQMVELSPSMTYVSRGNVMIEPGMGSAATDEGLRQLNRKSVQLGELMRQVGARCDLSVDALISQEHPCYLTEGNLRKGNGWYARQLRDQLRPRGFEVVGLNVFKPAGIKLKGFPDVKRILGRDFYTGKEACGVIPIVPTLSNQVHLCLVARCLSDYRDLHEEVWKRFDCAGTPPRLKSEVYASAI